MSSAPLHVGFVGCGIMGQPMAGHVLRAGHRVSLFSRTRAKTAALCSEGAAWRDSPGDVAADCDILLIMVTDTPDVEAVLFGAGGAAERLRPSAIVVDLSTINPAAAREMARRLGQRGVEMLDAPVTGGDIGARNGTLTVMVGGSAAALERVRPVLATFAKRIIHVGPSGAGQTLKACNQILCAVNMIGLCEALTLAAHGGIGADVLIDALSAGAGGSWALANYGPRIARGDLAPGFMVRLQQKDLRIVQDAAERLGVPLPGTALAQQLFRAVEALPGGGDLGTQALIVALRRLAGDRGDQGAAGGAVDAQ